MTPNLNQYDRLFMRMIARVLQAQCAFIGIDAASPDGYALAETLVRTMRENPMCEKELTAFARQLTARVNPAVLTIH